MTSLRGGFGGAELDTGAALALATAQGVPPATAAAWLSDFLAGMIAGLAAKEERNAPVDRHEGRQRVPGGEEGQ